MFANGITHLANVDFRNDHRLFGISTYTNIPEGEQCMIKICNDAGDAERALSAALIG